MIAIKNLEPKELKFDFEGLTYFFPKGDIVLVEEKLVEHLKEVVPLAFDFEVKLPKGEQVAKVKTAKTRSMFGIQPAPETDMKTTRAGVAVGTFNPEDGTEGGDFYGQGIEVEDIK